MNDTLRHNILRAANRLRMVQANFADEDEERQREYLSGELEELLKAVPYGQHRAFLDALLEEFPLLMGGQAWLQRGPGTAETPSEGASAGDPDSLIAELANVLPTLSEAQKQRVLELLGQAGIAPSAPAATAPAASGKRLRATLQMRGDNELHEERFAELADVLTEFVIRLEPLVAGVWGKVSPRSRVRPSRNFRKTARDFLAEETASSTGLGQELTTLLQYVTAIVAGVSHAGDEFANRWSSILSPEAISTVVDMKKDGLLKTLSKTREAKCWEQYCVQAEEHLSRDAIEKEVREAIGRHAESVLKGLGRLV